MKPEGRGIVLVEDGALFRAGKDGAVRRSILAEDVIEAVIALPDGVLGGRAFSLSVNLVLLNKRKPKVLSKKILFVNARGNDTMRAGRERNFSMCRLWEKMVARRLAVCSLMDSRHLRQEHRIMAAPLKIDRVLYGSAAG